MNVEDAVQKLKTAAADRFDHLAPNERERYHKESFAVGYSFGIIDHLKWQREHAAAAQATILANNDAEADGA